MDIWRFSRAGRVRAQILQIGLRHHSFAFTNEPIKSAQAEGSVRRLLHLRRYANSERVIAKRGFEATESLAEASRAGEDVDDSDGVAGALL